MTIYYASKKTVVQGTQVAITSNVDVTALYNSVIANTYNFDGIQIYTPDQIKVCFPLYYNQLDADGKIKKDVMDKILTPDQKQNTIISDINAIIDVNNYITTTIKAGNKIQFKLFHKNSVNFGDMLRNKN
jgi:hypothetical protein